MSEIYDVEILKTLQGAVKTAVGSSVPVKYLGRNFDPPNNQKWLEIIFNPNNPPSGYWGSEKDYIGFMRLILHWPNDDKGAYEPMTLISTLTSAFSKDNFLQNVKIYDNPNFMGVIENGKELLYPVNIRYTCFRP